MLSPEATFQLYDNYSQLVSRIGTIYVMNGRIECNNDRGYDSKSIHVGIYC